MMLSTHGIFLLTMGIGALCEPLPRNLIPRQAGSSIAASPVYAAYPPSPARRDLLSNSSTSSLMTATTTENALSVLSVALTRTDTAGAYGTSNSDYPPGAGSGGVDNFAAASQPGGTSPTTVTPTIAGGDPATTISATSTPYNGNPLDTNLPKPVQYMASSANGNNAATVSTTTTVYNSPSNTLAPSMMTYPWSHQDVTTTVTVSQIPTTTTEAAIGCSFDSFQHIGPDEIVDQQQSSCGPLIPSSNPPTSFISTPFETGNTWIATPTSSTTTLSDTGSTWIEAITTTSPVTTSPTTTPTTVPSSTTTTTTTEEDGFIDKMNSGVVHMATAVTDAFKPEKTQTQSPKPSTAGAARLAPLWGW